MAGAVQVQAATLQASQLVLVGIDQGAGGIKVSMLFNRSIDFIDCWNRMTSLFLSDEVSDQKSWSSTLFQNTVDRRLEEIDYCIEKTQITVQCRWVFSIIIFSSLVNNFCNDNGIFQNLIENLKTPFTFCSRYGYAFHQSYVTGLQTIQLDN